MSVPPKCCYCREPIQPVNGKWIGISSQKPACKHAPNKQHARQVVIGAAK